LSAGDGEAVLENDVGIKNEGDGRDVFRERGLNVAVGRNAGRPGADGLEE
jgi:hypothetical protein